MTKKAKENNDKKRTKKMWEWRRRIAKENVSYFLSAGLVKPRNNFTATSYVAAT